jgi:hypothetical protein
MRAGGPFCSSGVTQSFFSGLTGVTHHDRLVGLTGVTHHDRLVLSAGCFLQQWYYNYIAAVLNVKSLCLKCALDWGRTESSRSLGCNASPSGHCCTKDVRTVTPRALAATPLPLKMPDLKMPCQRKLLLCGCLWLYDRRVSQSARVRVWPENF